jgi:hypothetical protein
VRHQRLASYGLENMGIPLNMTEVFHLTAEKTFHHGIDLAENFMGIFSAVY